MSPITTLAGLLGLSLILSAGLGIGYLGQRDKATQALEQRDSARTAASACSDATEALRELADKRKVEAASARAAAAVKATTLDKRADATLSQQPIDPANSCASIQALGDDWLKGREGK
jgi:type II secretory pathway pseudopilin PulG